MVFVQAIIMQQPEERLNTECSLPTLAVYVKHSPWIKSHPVVSHRERRGHEEQGTEQIRET